MDGFTHEKLDAYRVSVEFSAVAEQIAENLPRGRGYLADQLKRCRFMEAEAGSGNFATAVAVAMTDETGKPKARVAEPQRRAEPEP